MGRRYRLYPTVGQAERLTGWGHTCRAVWNVALAQRQFLYAQRGIRLRAAGQHRQLTEARAELDWLANLPAQSGQQVLAHLDRAYDNWWNLKHPAGPPRFKKRRDKVSVPFPGQAVAVRKLNNRWAEVRRPRRGGRRRGPQRARRRLAASAEAGQERLELVAGGGPAAGR
jgi:putative transposase